MIAGAAPPARWQLRAEMPAHSARADEAQERDAGIGRECFGKRVGLGKESLTPALRQSGFTEQVDEFNAGERR
jgi:hypothetical protein